MLDVQYQNVSSGAEWSDPGATPSSELQSIGSAASDFPEAFY